jgi:hypothetical protein
MMVKARTRLACLAALLVLSLSGRAQAHPEFSAVGTNRFVTAAVLDGRVDVTDALLLGALTSVEQRRALDSDGDGSVSEAERLAGEKRMEAAGPELGVEVDSQAVAAPVTAVIDLGGDPRVAAPALVIERRQSFTSTWPDGQHRLRLAVAREPTRLLDTELGIVLGSGLSLQQPDDRVTFKGPRHSSLEDRSATFVFTKAPAPPKRPALPVPVLVLVAVAVAVVVLVRRRRQRRGIDARM